MTDIVERLTDAEKLFIKAGVDGENGAKLVADARDEIGRLRAALKFNEGAWDNVLDLGLLPEQHRDTAREILVATRAALTQGGE